MEALLKTPILPQDELEILMQKHKGPCISIFMPAYRTEVQQNTIRFKNMLRKAEELLHARGWRESETKGLLGPVQGLLKDSYFWQHQRDGLAVFRSSELFRYYPLPTRFEELVVVADRFHVKPLFSLFNGDGQFYVLALSQKDVRLLKGSRYSITEVNLEGVPKSLAEALQYDDYSKLTHFYPGSQGRPSGKITPLAGHGVGGDDDKREPRDEIRRYFLQIDVGLHDLLKEERAPLVLAGVEYLLPIYREVSTYPHLMEEGITGNPEGLHAEELHERAWTLVQPYFQKALNAAAAQYRQFAGTQRASHDIHVVLPAAYYGRVDFLFVATNVQQWGTFDPNTHTVQLHSNPEPGDEDLLDLAAVQTFLHGGRVYAVSREEIPDDHHHGSLAAVFRY